MPKFFVPAGRHPEALRARWRRLRLLGRAGLSSPPQAGSVVDYGVVEELRRRAGRAVPGRGDRDRSVEQRPATQTRLQEQGLPVVTFGQGFASMSPAREGGRAADPEPAARARRQPGDAVVLGQRRDRPGPGRQLEDRSARRPGRRWTARSPWPWRSAWRRAARRQGRSTRSGRASCSSEAPAVRRRRSPAAAAATQFEPPSIVAVARLLAIAPSWRPWSTRHRSGMRSDAWPCSPAGAGGRPIGSASCWSRRRASRSASGRQSAGITWTICRARSRAGRAGARRLLHAPDAASRFTAPIVAIGGRSPSPSAGSL